MAFAQKRLEPRPNPHQASFEEHGSSPRRDGGGRVPLDEEPMTGVQATYLKLLSEEANEPAAYERNLTRREAARRINQLKDRLGLLDPPPHTD